MRLVLRDPNDRRIALRSVMQPMLQAGDHQAVVAWLKSGKGVPEFDSARSLAIPYLAQTDPAVATALLADMVDPKMKNSVARQAAFVISRSSAGLATGLPAEKDADGRIDPPEAATVK